MPGYLIDTQTITYWFDGESGRYPAVEAAAQARRSDSPIYISAISVGEIEFGHAVHPAGAGARRDAFVKFLREQLPQVLPVSRHTTEPYGLIRARLFETLPPRNKTRARRAEQICDPTTGRELGIDENDLWIVSQAAERNLVLVTHDKLVRIRDALRELELRVRIEDWAGENGMTDGTLVHGG